MKTPLLYSLGAALFCGCEPGATYVEVTDTGAEDTGLHTSAAGATRYPADWTHSPMTSELVEGLDALLASPGATAPNVFMKAGDSITYSTNYLHCFADSDVDLGEHTDLQDALDHFLGGDADGNTPFDRWSHAVLGAKTASWALDGDPSPVEQEIEAIAPDLAVVMFGTNDASYYADDTGEMLRWYGAEMLTMADVLVDANVIPILMTIPPKIGSSYVHRNGIVNGVIRGIAQGFQVPLVDYNRVMLEAPSWGLSSDGIHPSATGGGCDLTEAGLEYGYNLRNLLTLQVLDRVHGAFAGDPDGIDAVQPLSGGTGAPEDPIEIDQLPFTRMSDTTQSDHDAFDSYPDCDAGQNESGPDEHYALHLVQDQAMRIAVIDREGVDVDVHLLRDDGSETCLARDDTVIEGTLPAGDYRVVVDTFVSSEVEQTGEYVLVVVGCDEGDEDCAPLLE